MVANTVLRGDLGNITAERASTLRPRKPLRPLTLNCNATMAVLSWTGAAANGGSAASTQKLASLTWSDESVDVETCGRSYWSFLQRTRAIDHKQLGNVSAFQVDDGVEEEVRGFLWSGEG